MAITIPGNGYRDLTIEQADVSGDILITAQGDGLQPDSHICLEPEAAWALSQQLRDLVLKWELHNHDPR